MEISVVIPTYRRPRQLLRALESLREQNLPECEIVIVDNAASSEIAQLIARRQAAFKVPLHYVPESKLGLHHARHAGAEAAIGRVLVFSDDDATFDPGWLRAYAKAFTVHPQMMAAGGPVRPVWEATPPKWLQAFRSDQKIFPILSLMEPQKEFSVGPRGFFFGVNMAIRRRTMFEVGGFNPEMFGESWLGDGESGLNYKLWEREMFVGYVPDAVVYHHIPRERMTVEYFRRRMANEGACQAYTRFHREMPRWGGLLGCAASIMLRNCVYWLIAQVITGRTDRLSLRVQLRAARTLSQFNYVVHLMRDKELRQFVLKDDWLNHSGSAL